jgi:hypothetical protein
MKKLATRAAGWILGFTVLGLMLRCDARDPVSLVFTLVAGALSGLLFAAVDCKLQSQGHILGGQA